MKIRYTIKVFAGPEELEQDSFAGMFGLAKAHAMERFEAHSADGATRAVVHDDIGRTVFTFPKTDQPNERLR